MQARQLGRELYVGVHSDEAILENKGPTVMRLNERIMAVEACRWATKAIPHAPYVTSLPWITHYGCQFVVHGDDITSDSDGKDCYRYVKAAGRFKVVKRTPGISTTDLVGRMLLCTRSHFIQSLEKRLSGDEGPGSEEERQKEGAAMLQRIKDYATDASGKAPGCDVWYWHASRPAKLRRTTTSNANGATSSSSEARPGVARAHTTQSMGPVKEEKGKFHQLVQGKGVKPGQVVVYVDGGWDLFSSGHIEFLKKVTETEENAAKQRGWYAEEAKADRISKTGEDYGPVFLVAGIHDDEVINHYKGINFPIMNIFERGLCVVQCKYVHSVVFGAPFAPTKTFLTGLPAVSAAGKPNPDVVYHGPTSFMPSPFDEYADAKSLCIFTETPAHSFQDVNAAHIVKRILDNREQYEERQRKKGVKGVGEEATKKREQMEKEAADALKKQREEARKELQRRHSEVERQFGM